MTAGIPTDTRTKLLDAAADLIAAAPGEAFALRDVCAKVGVKMPTLYHFFGNKQGLIDAVVERGFELCMSVKASGGSSGDPIQDVRAGWDAHVAFGLANPGFYSLMYGQVRPGYVPSAERRPREALMLLLRAAEKQGRLVVPVEQAAEHILAANIGITLRQIAEAKAAPVLSTAICDGVIAAITGTVGAKPFDRAEARRAYEYATAHPDVLGETETRLLGEWLQRLTA